MSMMSLSPIKRENACVRLHSRVRVSCCAVVMVVAYYSLPDGPGFCSTSPQRSNKVLDRPTSTA